MSDVITIDGEKYFVEEIPQDTRQAMLLLQEAQKRQQEIMLDVQMINAAVDGLSIRVKEGIKDVDPIPGPAKEEAKAKKTKKVEKEE